MLIRPNYYAIIVGHSCWIYASWLVIIIILEYWWYLLVGNTHITWRLRKLSQFQRFMSCNCRNMIIFPFIFGTINLVIWGILQCSINLLRIQSLLMWNGWQLRLICLWSVIHIRIISISIHWNSCISSFPFRFRNMRFSSFWIIL